MVWPPWRGHQVDNFLVGSQTIWSCRSAILGLPSASRTTRRASVALCVKQLTVVVCKAGHFVDTETLMCFGLHGEGMGLSRASFIRFPTKQPAGASNINCKRSNMSLIPCSLCLELLQIQECTRDEDKRLLLFVITDYRQNTEIFTAVEKTGGDAAQLHTPALESAWEVGGFDCLQKTGLYAGHVCSLHGCFIQRGS